MSWVVLDGSDPDFLYFGMGSFTDPFAEYELTICKRTGRIECGCPDAWFRRKKGDVFNANLRPCKHVQSLRKICRSIILDAQPRHPSPP